jgi:hypothetical protein
LKEGIRRRRHKPTPTANLAACVADGRNIGKPPEIQPAWSMGIHLKSEDILNGRMAYNGVKLDTDKIYFFHIIKLPYYWGGRLKKES